MKRVIIILTSIILLVLSFLSINKKIIQPIIANKKFEKEIEAFEKEIITKIEENEQKKEEEIKQKQETEYVSIELPDTEEEVCKTVIGLYFHSL